MRGIAVAVFATAVFAVSGLPAWADETSPPAAQQTAATPDPDAIVCETLPPPTGTRIGSRRICQTQRQWDELHNQASEDLSRRQQKLGNPQTGGGGG